MTVRPQLNQSTMSFKDDVDLLPFSEVLFVAKDEESAREDKRVLRRTGFRGMQFFSSGVNLIRYILATRKNIDSSHSCLVICHEQVSDMDANNLISLLRLHPQGNIVPVLVFSNSEMFSSHAVPFENRREKYKSLGAFDVLARPLTPNDIFHASQEAYSLYEKMDKKRKVLEIAVGKAQEELKERYYLAEKEKIKFFELTIAKFSFESPLDMSYEDAYYAGCEKLNHKAYDQAWQYFKRAITDDSACKPDALFGLYLLYKEQQEAGSSKIYLIQACQAYIDNGDWDRVEDCVIRFSEEFPKCSHPILGIIATAIKRSDTEQLGFLLRTTKEHLSHEKISRAIVNGCFYYELSSNIMDVLSVDVNIFTRVLELLQERRLERQVREQGILLQRASAEHAQSNLTTRNNGLAKFAKNDSLENSLPEYNDTDSLLSKDSIGIDGLGNDEFFEGLSVPLEKTQVRLGIGSMGAIESLPLVVLSERGKGSFFGDIITIAKQTAKIYKESR